MSEDTGPGAMHDAHDAAQDAHKRKLLRFDPTVSSGTLLQIMVLVGGGIAAYATYQTDKALQAREVEQIKSTATSEKQVTKEALSEIKTDVKEVQRTLNQVSQALAVIDARQPRQQPPKVAP